MNEKTELKIYLNQLEQNLSQLQAHNSVIERKSEDYFSEVQSLKNEIEKMNKNAVEVSENEKKTNKAVADELSSRIQVI